MRIRKLKDLERKGYYNERGNLKIKGYPGYMNSDMLKICGKEITIIRRTPFNSVSGDYCYCYRIKEDYNYWQDWMFQHKADKLSEDVLKGWK